MRQIQNWKEIIKVPYPQCIYELLGVICNCISWSINCIALDIGVRQFLFFWMNAVQLNSSLPQKLIKHGNARVVALGCCDYFSWLVFSVLAHERIQISLSIIAVYLYSI